MEKVPLSTAIGRWTEIDIIEGRPVSTTQDAPQKDGTNTRAYVSREDGQTVELGPVQWEEGRTNREVPILQEFSVNLRADTVQFTEAGRRAVKRLRKWDGTSPPPQTPYSGPLGCPTPRNAPCPCGSGRKYKRCHRPK